MQDDVPFWQLLQRALVAVAICAALVAFCYFFVDRPVAFYVHDHHFNRVSLLRWLTYPPPIFQAWVPVLLVVLMVRRGWSPLRGWELTLLAACVSLLVADQFRQTLSFAFGRYWPATWIDNNPSLIQDGAYGFHPFSSGPAFGSFPSGHMARTLAVASVVWIAHRRWRWLCVVSSVAVAVGLVGMDYHFVGDTIAGSFVGAIVGTYTAYLWRMATRA